MEKIYIHKGDCTIFADVKSFLTFNIETEMDLAGYKAQFILGYITKQIDDISSKSFEVILSAEETRQLRLGEQHGAVILTDNNGHIKTVVNTIPFVVTNDVVDRDYQLIDLTIPETSGLDIKLKVGSSAVTSVNGMTGDVVIDIPSDLSEYVKNTDYATNNKAGLVFPVSNAGLTVLASGGMYIEKATTEYIDRRVSDYRPITPTNLDYAVKTSITTNALELTDEEKTNAKAWLGYAEPNDIMQAIAAIPQFKLSIVDELPLAGEKMTLYLVPKEGTNNDVYDEYIWIEQTTSFEHLGTTAVDLTDYVKNTDYATSNGKAGIISVSPNNLGTNVTNGYLNCPAKTLEQYQSGLADYGFISKGTLNNVLTQYSKTVSITQADYEALETKDANTLYLIEE